MESVQIAGFPKERNAAWLLHVSGEALQEVLEASAPLGELHLNAGEKCHFFPESRRDWSWEALPPNLHTLVIGNQLAPRSFRELAALIRDLPKGLRHLRVVYQFEQTGKTDSDIGDEPLAFPPSLESLELQNCSHFLKGDFAKLKEARKKCPSLVSWKLERCKRA